MPCSGCPALHGVNPNFLKKSWKGILESNKLRINDDKTKIMITIEKAEKLTKEEKFYVQCGGRVRL